MKISTLAGLLFLAQISFAQDYIGLTDLYSRTGVGGTARTAGSGNAYGSVGADLGCLDINPAGLGLYRSTDFSITPALKIGSNTANYDGSNTNALAVKPYISQGGIAFTKLFNEGTKNDDKGMGFQSHPLRSFTFALNFQTSNFFNRNQNFNATNSSNSLMDNYASLGNYYGAPPQYTLLEIGLANAVNLLGYDSFLNGYTSNVHAPVQQMGTIQTRGSTSKIDFGFGGNFGDKVYFGFDIAIPFINYVQTESMTETNASDSTRHFLDYQLTSTVNDVGVGFTGSVGLIYRPISWMRIGASYHLPTWYSINEDYSSIINADYDTLYGYGASGSYPTLHYGIRTPMRGVASASFYYKEHGFFSIDYDFQNLGSSRFKSSDPNFSQAIPALNDSIKTNLGYLHTIRAGLEGAVSIMRFRLGYSFSTSPLKKSGYEYTPGYPETIQSVSAGFGVRTKKGFYADLAYVIGITKDAPSGLLYTDPITNNYVTHTVLLTLGWKLTGSADKAKKQRKTYQAPPPVDEDKY